MLFFSASGSSKDTQIGPYPKTPEEIAAAAKKYNLTVADYQPYPDKGEGWGEKNNNAKHSNPASECSLVMNSPAPLSSSYGDYPKLPDRSQHERDPWYEWDHTDLRRNWGEPVRFKLTLWQQLLRQCFWFHVWHKHIFVRVTSSHNIEIDTSRKCVNISATY